MWAASWKNPLGGTKEKKTREKVQSMLCWLLGLVAAGAKQVWRLHAQHRGLLGSGSHPQDPQRIVLGKPFQPHASQELRKAVLTAVYCPACPLLPGGGVWSSTGRPARGDWDAQWRGVIWHPQTGPPGPSLDGTAPDCTQPLHQAERECFGLDPQGLASSFLPASAFPFFNSFPIGEILEHICLGICQFQDNWLIWLGLSFLFFIVVSNFTACRKLLGSFL